MSKIQITSHKVEVMNALQSQIEKALTECGMVAEGYSKLLCPVDTGNLRNSISYKVQDNDCYIGTNVEYAAYVEMGTGSHYAGGSGIRGREAKPYLKPAIDEHRDEYKKIIEDTLKG